tara:strand:- start:49 stop:471 length:423 start_codon:yes stop_codon:yes gene_type:complete
MENNKENELILTTAISDFISAIHSGMVVLTDTMKSLPKKEDIPSGPPEDITSYMRELRRAYSPYKTQSQGDRKPCPFSAEEIKTLHRIRIPIADAILIGEKIDKTPKYVWRKLSNGKRAHIDMSPVVPLSAALREVMGWE